MKNYEKAVIDILRSSIINPNDKYTLAEDIDVIDVLEEAKEQGVLSLIYYYLDRDSLENYREDKRFEDMKKQMIMRSSMEIIRLSKIMNVIRDLNNLGVNVTILKGLQVKKYYLRSEFREMSDADLLIRAEDYDIVKQYFIDRGCVEETEDHDVHRSYIYEGILYEIHLKLINSYFYKYDKDEFENNVWNNLIQCDYYKEFDINNLLIYLIMHTVVHAKFSGFGIRFLYDMAIIIQKDMSKIDWTYLMMELDKYGIKKFAEGIFKTINDYYGVEISQDIIKGIDSKESKMIVDNMIISGKNGKKLENPDFIMLSRYGEKENAHSFRYKKLRMYFPKKKTLAKIKGYEYVMKYPITYIYACLHYHIKEGLFKKYTRSERKLYSNKAIVIGKSRKELIEHFKL